MGKPSMARALVALLLCAALAHAVPTEDSSEAIGDLMMLAQERTGPVPTVSHYTREQFAVLMNKIIMRASKMREVMNKLGISDTESVRQVEQHFVALGEEHEDLGDGMTNQEDLRLHGLRARECVKHATSCSRMAAGCPHGPKHCKSVVNHCSRAASACGIGESKKVKKTEAKKAKKVADEAAVSHEMNQHAVHEAAVAAAKAKHIHEESVKEAEEVYDEAAAKADAKVEKYKKKSQATEDEGEELDEETESLSNELELAEADMDDTVAEDL